jgi:hypothetical protein
MSADDDRNSDEFVTEDMGAVVGYAFASSLGTLLLVASVRSFLKYLDVDISRGVGVDLLTVVLASTAGWTLLLAGLMGASYHTLSAARE